MKINNFTRSEHTRLSKAIEAALKSVGDDFGVDLTAAGGVYGSNNAHVKIAVTIRDTGTGMSSAESEFRRMAPMYGMKPEWYGQAVILQGTAYEIVGIKPSAPKYTVQIKRCYDGKIFGCTVSTVTRQLGMKTAA